MILILAPPDDPVVDFVLPRLRMRSVNILVLDASQFPAQITATTAPGEYHRCRIRLRESDRVVDLTEVTAVWNRRTLAPVPDPVIQDPPTRAYVAEECWMFLSDLWMCLDCLWCPAPSAVVHVAQFKGLQLKVAADLGFEIPSTIVTTDRDELLDFYRHHSGRVVSKLASATAFSRHWRNLARYTVMVTRRDLGHLASLRHCPMIFQACVPKRFEVRVTVVGQDVFSAEIHSQSNNRTKLDWRRYDFAHTPHRSHVLPPSIEYRCRALVEKLGLTYGAIDLVFTPDGRYVFLEINPAGQFSWIEELTGLPISEALCDLLAAGRRVPAAHGIFEEVCA
jgi:hypothetical protein